VESFHSVSKLQQARDKVDNSVGVYRRPIEKITQIIDAAGEDPEEFGDLLEKMGSTGKVNRTGRGG
jgi:hypothetical protein